MTDAERNAPCPCGSGQKYKNCHGAAAAPTEASAAAPLMPGMQDDLAAGMENPFRRIFKPDGTVNSEYVMTRLRHLEGLVRENPLFFPLRFDRDTLEKHLAERQDIFADAEGQEEFEVSFRRFAAAVLPSLVTKEFDERAKETLKTALSDKELSPRDRAAAACGMVLTMPTEGEPSQPHDENPFLDLVLRVTFNESMSRVDFFHKLAESGEMSDTERDARVQEFLRSVPALLFELQQGFERVVKRALESYERGEYSFGIGIDMILHGLRAIRQLTTEYEEQDGDAFTDDQNKEFSEKFGAAIREAYAQDIAEDEENELIGRMAGFLESARQSGEKKAARGLSSALEVMEQNPEIRYRMFFAAYHEAVTGSRIFRDDAEEEPAKAIFEDPFDAERYLDYGECLEREGYPIRSERVYRSALEFFPEDEEVRQRLEAVAQTLEPERNEEIQARIRETESNEDDE